MYRRSDPRFRRTINEISQTIESANESAQANIFTFSHRYLGPCFSSIGNCFQSCSSCVPCCDDRLRRSRARSRARPELSFDFYDDWDDDETAGLLAWDTEDASYGAGTVSDQPARERAMSYGARRDKYGHRKPQPRDDPDTDPTLIPATSYFGFLGKFSSKITGGKALRYKPSAADLQEHPGASRTMPPLAEENDDFSPRKRSNTTGSNATVDSFSSRGDLFPSEDEDDAHELDDEFAMVLERRTTGAGLEDVNSNGKPRRPGKRPSTGSRMSTRTMSSRSTRSSKRRSRVASSSPSREAIIEREPKSIPSMTELKQEEERLREEEETAIAEKRDAARGLALKRGLSVSEPSPMEHMSSSAEPKPAPSPDTTRDESTGHTQEHKLPISSASAEDDRSTGSDTVPFPSFDPQEAVDDETEFVPAQMPRFAGS
ncbi:hypothetical protein D6D13_00150 [Aureobasidium pullulans]|uniref:Uncharacterized protein n=1 Tax=Aureobasidium pullulans TaxID=5580 RepID=A0A4S9DCH5_AURPU|nr:hypothetical protein D6D13_00150 [Aureobasidium pullulans]